MAAHGAYPIRPRNEPACHDGGRGQGLRGSHGRTGACREDLYTAEGEEEEDLDDPPGGGEEVIELPEAIVGDEEQECAPKRRSAP